jgi:cobalamin biosynthesis protein CobD/CbiB
MKPPGVSSSELDVIRQKPPITPDGIAQQELRKTWSKNRREESEKNILHYGILALIVCVSLVAIVAICCRLVHLILPDHIQWLTEMQVQSIDKLFFSSAIGGFVVNYLKKSGNDLSGN